MAERQTERRQYVEEERARIAKGGFFHAAAVWLLSCFPLTKDKYQSHTKAFETGVFNICRSDASCRPKLDRDNDGIAYEH